MYRDLKEIYWSEFMKQDISMFAEKCPNCQQFKAEQLKPGGLTKSIEIPTWKWEFTYKAEDYATLYIDEIVRWHGIPLSIIADGGDSLLLTFEIFPKDLGRCRSPVGWFEVGESFILGPEIIHEAMGKVRMIRDRLTTTYSRKNYYVDNRKRALEFEVIQHPSCLLRGHEEVTVEILDHQVKQLRNKEVASVKVLWRNNLVIGETWEAKADMRSRYPHLFSS
ncbi:uncharacterized protein [Solanum lycopersicum]|uniref:uncharacterized protein n=1 Tax=Solanum lycopersicum TaxID=4081 RepID=UPI0037481C5D